MAFLPIVISCSDDKEVKKTSDPDVTHTGEKWNIASLEYLLIDQSTGGSIGQTIKSDTKANAGSFYFDTDKGSFEFDIEGYHKEDVFSFTKDGSDMTVINVEQGAGATISQNILALTGSQTSDDEMTLDGNITKQSATGQFVLTATFTLVKE